MVEDDHVVVPARIKRKLGEAGDLMEENSPIEFMKRLHRMKSRSGIAALSLTTDAIVD